MYTDDGKVDDVGVSTFVLSVLRVTLETRRAEEELGFGLVSFVGVRGLGGAELVWPITAAMFVEADDVWSSMLTCCWDLQGEYGWTR